MKYHVYVLQKFNQNDIFYIAVNSEQAMYDTVNHLNIIIDHDKFQVKSETVED